MSDGNIQSARTKLGRAVQHLTGPRQAVYHDATLYAPSLYATLAADLAGTQGDSRTPAKSLPPLWIDACQLLFEIDHKTVKWCPKPGNTPQRLQMLSFATWRPQDTDIVQGMARTIEGWCETINNLLDPESVKHISAACPSCGREKVFRRDSAGEMVQQPALKVVTNVGCTCQHCQAHWAPEKYLFLCKLLGFELPEGVLE